MWITSNKIHSQLPQTLERLQYPLDLVAALFVFAAEMGGEVFGIGRAVGEELAEQGDLVRQPFRPGGD